MKECLLGDLQWYSRGQGGRTSTQSHSPVSRSMCSRVAALMWTSRLRLNPSPEGEGEQAAENGEKERERGTFSCTLMSENVQSYR